MVVFPDADVEEAVAGAVFGMNFTTCQGQSCGSNSRVLVHRRSYDEFVARTAEQLRNYTVGVAYDDKTDMGPLVSAQQYERVTRYLEAGVRVSKVITLSEHRPFAGLTVPTKIEYTRNGQIAEQWAVESWEFPDTIDDAVFVEPK